MVVLTLPYPVSANRYWRSCVRDNRAITYVTPEASAYKETVGWIARGAGIRKPLPGRVWADLQLYPPLPDDWARRARMDLKTWDDAVRCIDLDNAQKVVFDSLKNIVFGDDALVFKISAERMEPDKAGARVVVTIRQIARIVPQLDLLADVEEQA